jgi:putative DNA primase/helicase
MFARHKGAPSSHPTAPRQRRPIPIDDGDLLRRAATARNGTKFSALMNGDTSAYKSASEADLALCGLLAFWTDGNTERIDRIFRTSGLMRTKWDERRGDRTYGEDTIARACSARAAEAATDRNGLRPRRLTPTRGQSSTSTPLDNSIIRLDPADPLETARTYVQRMHLVDGVLALRHHAGGFYRFASDSAYTPYEPGTSRAELYTFLGSAHRLDGEPFRPTKSRIENVIDGLRAVCNLPARHQPPCWLQDSPGWDPLDVLACRNGLLHIPTRCLLDATPSFFTLNALTFEFNADAPPAARWLSFVQELWPSDEESRNTLQELLGYLLTPRTHLQKIAMLVGPKRSGKGTIGRTIRRLLGPHNVCGPTLASLSRQFGLSTLIGKSAAIIADARVAGRTDTGVVIERLLSISGEDALSVPRKFLPDWSGPLTTRFVLMTNELPRLEDASGALASRFVILRLHNSFYGCEDHTLAEQFVSELPGILNWALEGYDRLRARGRFQQPPAAADLIRQFEDLGSPVHAFIRDRCELGSQFEIRQDLLFEGWKTWCAEVGREKPGTTQSLGRSLYASVPGLAEVQHRHDGVPKRYYRGLRLSQ